ncbi:hypothetical protein BpHYR1_009849 [Brachionus plicatilis]|uniref:Uncharacterized protein n=1 Tax=Brachionus plicatilis TaxID=10195 RepID=A0A3M7SVE5_BRAPC|nr:hypothetical protein BpHYR1_009849 [Brachionus plicatilis]
MLILMKCCLCENIFSNRYFNIFEITTKSYSIKKSLKAQEYINKLSKKIDTFFIINDIRYISFVDDQKLTQHLTLFNHVNQDSLIPKS